MNEMKLASARAEHRREGRRGVRRRLRAVLTVLVVAALALPWTGCSSFPPCLVSVGDTLLDIHVSAVREPLRDGPVRGGTDSLRLLVGNDGDAVMVRLHEYKWRNPGSSRCRRLAADDLAEVIRTVERLERWVVAETRVLRPGSREMTRIVLRGDPVKTFSYSDTPPAEVVRFVEEISELLGRRFGKKLAAGLAATAPWASPVPLDQPRG